MGALPAKTYTVTPEEFAAIEKRAASGSGINIQGNSGTASKLGVTITWNYDGTTLTIDCTSHPFFVGAEEIQADIDKLVNGG